MNDSDLEKRLKAAPGPVLSPDYRATFPRQVLANLRSAPRAARERPPWRWRLAWGLGFALCLLLAFAAGHWHGRAAANQDALANAKLIRETLALFPHRVRAIVQDERGMNLVLSEKEDVPVSQPIYVRIQDGRQNCSMVTFSGQEIQIAGRKLTVLAEADGGIILTGDQFVWSSNDGTSVKKPLQIEARNLSLATM